MPFELKSLLRLGLAEGRFDIRGDDSFRVGIEILQEIAAARTWIGHAEQSVVQAHLRLQSVLDGYPMQVTFDLLLYRARAAAARFGLILAVHHGYVAVGILIVARALDDVRVAQPHFV